MNSKLVKSGLIAAAIMNIGGVLIFSRAFTNVAISNADPVVMSNFGLTMIIVWVWPILVLRLSSQAFGGWQVLLL